MNRPVIDYFRCPENFLQFQLAGPLSADSGFFAFGPQTICYGRTSSGFRSRRVTDRLHDALADVKVDEQGALDFPWIRTRSSKTSTTNATCTATASASQNVH